MPVFPAVSVLCYAERIVFEIAAFLLVGRFLPAAWLLPDFLDPGVIDLRTKRKHESYEI